LSGCDSENYNDKRLEKTGKEIELNTLIQPSFLWKAQLELRRKCQMIHKPWIGNFGKNIANMISGGEILCTALERQLTA